MAGAAAPNPGALLNPGQPSTANPGGGVTGQIPGQVGYYPGMNPPNLPSGSQAATGAAQGAVQGLQSAYPGGPTTGSGAGGSPYAYTGGGQGSSYSVNDKGQTSYTVTPDLLPQQAQLQQQQTALEGQIASGAATQAEQLGQDAFSSKLAALQPYLGAGGANGTAPVNLDTTDMTAANNAALAAAKNNAGANGRAALNALNDQMGARGITGSGLATGNAANVINSAANQVGQVNQQNLINTEQNNMNLAEQQYQGQIAQRGQNLQAQNALLGLVNAGIKY